MIRLLLLSGASLVGQNVLAALAGRRHSLHLTAINSVATEPTLADFDEVYLSGNLVEAPEAFRERFEEVLEAARPDLVIPCRDDDVLFLAEMRERLPAWRERLLCGAAATARATLDKLDSWHFSQAHGLPFVPTVAADAPIGELLAFADAHGFPLLAKPRRGFASRGVSLLLDATQLQRIAGEPGLILQRYLGDPAAVGAYVRQVREQGVPLFHSFEAVKHSLQAFIAPDARVIGTLVTRNTMRQGRSERVVCDHDPDMQALAERCAAVFSAQGWRGPLNVQCQRDADGMAMIYEYNGRFTGATAARQLMGYDEPGMALTTFCGCREVAGDGPATAVNEVLRLPSSRGVDRQWTGALAQTGHWYRR